MYIYKYVFLLPSVKLGVNGQHGNLNSILTTSGVFFKYKSGAFSSLFFGNCILATCPPTTILWELPRSRIMSLKIQTYK